MQVRRKVKLGSGARRQCTITITIITSGNMAIIRAYVQVFMARQNQRVSITSRVWKLQTQETGEHTYGRGQWWEFAEGAVEHVMRKVLQAAE